MRKLTGKCKWILAVLIVAVSMAAGCNKIKTTDVNADDSSEASHKISVVATVFPYYDFARAIGGEYLDVTLLLPPGRDSHSFEPTAQDLLTLQSADIFLYNGGEMNLGRRGVRSSSAQPWNHLSGNRDSRSARRGAFKKYENNRSLT